MSAEENKAVIHQFTDGGWNEHSFEAVERLLAPDYTNHFPGAPYPLDRDGFKETAEELFRAFPDIRLQLHEMIAERDSVAARYTIYGTHLGPFMGMPPSRRRIVVPGTAFYRLKDGKIVDDHPGFDALSLMQQLDTSTAGETTDSEDYPPRRDR